MKQFINQRSDIVTEAIDGFLRTTANPNLARLNGYPHTKVVVRSDWDKTRVALISGGGSGHEPAHAGFVGEGMLTAAICGEVFASPSVDAVLAGIMAVSGDAGCLLIVKNYTGDRLNFGLAAERAKSMGYQVEMVIVADDVAIPDAPHPRGVAGTLFVHKIAGQLAAEGGSLQEVTACAQSVADQCASIGLSLETCTVPGNEKIETLDDDQAELGLGIHGEPGVSKIAMDSADALMARVCDELEAVIKPGNKKYAALINNLGVISPLEMNILANAFSKTSLANSVELILGPAHLMTSLDMYGFSLSLLQLDDSRFAALEHATGASAWPGIRRSDGIEIHAMPATTHADEHAPSDNESVRAAITAVCEILIKSEADLNTLDAKIGDGDTGSTFAAGAHSILSEADRFPYANSAELCIAMSRMLTRHMGGSSGVLLSILLVAAGKSLAQGGNWADSLMAGVRQMQVYGGAAQGDRTMLDAIIPALQALQNGDTLSAASDAARAGAEATAAMEKAAAGRASYVGSDDLNGVTDPGAEAIARVCKVLAQTIN